MMIQPYKGSSAGFIVAVSKDRDGKTRKYDIPEVVDSGVGSAPIVDIGAYEVSDPPPELQANLKSL
jgi:hypothetical protein